MRIKSLMHASRWLMLVWLFCASSAGAQIYKYKDENGQWVFTDKEPVTEQAETVDVPSAGESHPEPEVLARQEDGVNVLEVRNPLPAPIQAELTSEVFAGQAYHQLVPPQSTAVFYQGARAVPQFVFRWVMGDPAARQDNHAYRLPVPRNGTYLISQAFNGRFSHAGQASRYAVDFEMPVGTDITAARDGTVVLITDNYSFGGRNNYFLDKANHVMVLHEDGTYAAYAHILQGSATVDVGDSVVAGQRLARSGSSGFSTGPHLHFALLRNSNFQSVSIPFQFTDTDGNTFVPAEGMQVSNR